MDVLALLRSSTSTIAKLLDDATDKGPFDRASFAESLRVERAALSVVPGDYDPVLFHVAWKQLEADPSKLTEADIAQLRLVDPELGLRAVAARLGQTDAKAHDTSALDEMPVSATTLLSCIGKYYETLSTWISTIQRLARESAVRLDRLEVGIPVTKDGSTTVSTEAQIRSLTARVAELESRGTLSYVGVFQVGKRYSRGHVVTHAGSMWHCDGDTMLPPGSDGSQWRLCVKRGRDAR